jgi:hypothetical protein
MAVEPQKIFASTDAAQPAATKTFLPQMNADQQTGDRFTGDSGVERSIKFARKAAIQGTAQAQAQMTLRAQRDANLLLPLRPLRPLR